MGQETDIAALSWMAAKKAGIDRRAWCAAQSAKRQGKKKPAAPKPKKERTFALNTYPCVHRGGQAGETTCQSCGGKRVALKIFKCEKFEECTIEKLGDKIGPHCCKVCKVRTP